MQSASLNQQPTNSSPEIPNKSEVRIEDAIEEDDNRKRIQDEQCDSIFLLFKNTRSFRCLAQVLLSSSSLMKNRLYLFPPLEDPGIEEAYNYKEPNPKVDDTGLEKYVNMCKDLQIVPIRRIITSLEGPTLNLKFYGLTAKQMRALTECLKGNSYIETLILQDNWLDPYMTGLVTSMLEENSVLRVLNLRECRIGEKGAEKLNEALSGSQFLIELDLSFNDLGDVGLQYLEKGLCETPSLRKLNISHNNLTEDSAETLETVLLENKTITEIDLSWNGFFTGPGNKKLFNGFIQSDRIKVLSLAWNGIGTKLAVVPLVKYIKQSTTLQHIDLSSNRLAEVPLRMVRAGILKNHSLISVRIGSNPYQPDQAHWMASVMIAKAKDPLKYLDMENIYFTKEIVPLLTRTQRMGKIIKVGGILGNYEIKGPNVNKLLFERCRYLLMKPKSKKAQKDFGHFILTLPENPIPRQDFDNLLKKKKIKRLDKDLIDELTNMFTVKKKIDCNEMTKAYMKLYPETTLPVVQKKSKKKKGKKKSKTKVVEVEEEIGVVDLENAPEKTVDKSPSGINEASQLQLNKESQLKLVLERKSLLRKESSKLPVQKSIKFE
ncbi:uncharacterized protein isoform X1 [Leptinotarsa decemlineata]|uniref:uncharacterized protein isoform X1 n=1 Tax=Leptinotarsa decemlineata TaxID=7539 RepID=UPI003D309D69